MKPFVQLCAKGGSCEQLTQLDIVTTNEICICREQKDFDVRNFVNMETAYNIKMLYIILIENKILISTLECFKNYYM